MNVKTNMGVGGKPITNIEIILPTPPRKALIHIDRNSKVCLSMVGVIQSKINPMPIPNPPKKRRLLSRTGISGIAALLYMGLSTPKSRLIAAGITVSIASRALIIWRSRRLMILEDVLSSMKIILYSCRARFIHHFI